MEELKNCHNVHLQGDEAAVAALAREIMQQEYHPAHISHNVLIGPTTASESIEDPDFVTSCQLSANHIKCEDDVDVVGLL